MKDELDVRELLRNVAAAQALTGPTPRDRPAPALQEARGAEAEAPRWFDGKAARRLLGYLAPMERAARAAPVDAAAELLMALVEEDCASLLVLHAVLPAETLADYAQRCEGTPGWGLAWDRPDATSDTKPQRLVVTGAQGGAGRFFLNLGPTPPEHAAKGAAEWLGDFWHERLKAGRLDGLDRPPGLPPGAVLGVLEANAARLWPVLSELPKPAAMLSLDRDAVKRQQAAALEAAAPPDGFVIGKRWTDAQKVAFINAYDGLIASGMGKDAALSELAGKGWANSGATLAKRITEGNEARATLRGRMRVS